MFNTDLAYNQTITSTIRPVNYYELNRLLSAAIVSTSFRNMLFTKPETALTQGYQGEKFNLSNDEYSWLISVQVTDLASFATQLVEYQNARTAGSEIAIAVRLPEMTYIGSSD
jgi:hypothetical protein